jgi:hypothetical protein
MKDGWLEPRRLIVAGVALLAGGYAVLASGSRAWPAAGRLAFYSGLALLVAGVVIWLRQPPAPDPAEDLADDPFAEEGRRGDRE